MINYYICSHYMNRFKLHAIIMISYYETIGGKMLMILLYECSTLNRMLSYLIYLKVTFLLLCVFIIFYTSTQTNFIDMVAAKIKLNSFCIDFTYFQR